MHEADAEGDHEVFAAVHASPDAVAARRIDPCVVVAVVLIGATPLREEVIAPVEEGRVGVAVRDRPAEPAGDLIGEMGDAFGRVARAVREVVLEDAFAQGLDPLAEALPGHDFGGARGIGLGHVGLHASSTR